MRMMASSSARLAMLFAFAASGVAFSAQEFRGAAFEDHVAQASGRTLVLKGLSEVDHNYLPFYAAAMYLGQGNPDVRQLADARLPCRIELRWLINSLSPEQARDYWEAEFSRALGDPVSVEHLQASIKRFVTLTYGATRAESLTIDYDPDLGLAVSRNGESAVRFSGVEFSRALLGIWLGAKAPAARRDELLGKRVPAAPGPAAP
jgi:hypothetical protein